MSVYPQVTATWTTASCAGVRGVPVLAGADRFGHPPGGLLGQVPPDQRLGPGLGREVPQRATRVVRDVTDRSAVAVCRLQCQVQGDRQLPERHPQHEPGPCGQRPVGSHGHGSQPGMKRSPTTAVTPHGYQGRSDRPATNRGYPLMGGPSPRRRTHRCGRWACRATRKDRGGAGG
jgi:hypothetical protein